MRCVSAAAVLVLAACGTPAPTTVGPQRHFEVSFSVRYEAVREVDIVFALDSAEQGREHFTRVLDALGPFVDPPCISRTTPGGGPIGAENFTAETESQSSTSSDETTFGAVLKPPPALPRAE